MSTIPRYLKNYQSIIDAFGYWPTFHDSPVLRFRSDDTRIEMEIEAWETTSDTDDRGYFILTKKHRIGFSFSGIVSADLSSFIPENILFELPFSSEEDFAAQGLFSVELDSAMGSDLCGRFQAQSGEVTFIRPLQEQPKANKTAEATPLPSLPHRRR